MNICDANKAVSLEVKKFMLNVPDVKEESITDYLVWKWRELDARFKYINISTFTRQDESALTGADFEIELWLVGKDFHFPLVIQAKKFVKNNDSYVAKLNYPAGTQGQLATLIAYANSKKRLPFYVIYSVPDSHTKTMCRDKEESADTAIFMTDAHTIKKFADGQYGNRISKNKLLKATNPFHCIICCPLIQHNYYFARYFSALAEGAEPQGNEGLPNYVSMLLNSNELELEKDKTLSLIRENELSKFRVVGVYDLRFSDERPRRAKPSD